jgi:hypothetical protein
VKEELENKLIEKYPAIFKEIGSDPRHSCMAWGIECGDGWYDIIDALCGSIDNAVGIANRSWQDTQPAFRLEVHAAQIKQKYGSLRFYVDIGWTGAPLDEPAQLVVNKASDHFYGATDMAERMSRRICESCGQPGRINEGFAWLRCECDACSGEEL